MREATQKELGYPYIMMDRRAPVPGEPGALAASGLTVAYRERIVLHELDLAIPRRGVTAIVGANACGKSTLLRTLARLLRPRAGAVLLDGAAIHELPTRDVARRLGLLPQAPGVVDGITVEELVRRGRHPHRRALAPFGAADRAQVDWALAAAGADDLRERPLDELSGGQRQRAWIAMALAQDTEHLLLDEPTAHLDLAHQLDVLELLAALDRAERRTVVVVLHDLNQACRYAGHLVAMRAGRVVAAGAPDAIVDAALVEAVLGVRARVLPDPETGTPMVVPLAPVAAPPLALAHAQ
jgi:iron complex transport system ATP-binding protein